MNSCSDNELELLYDYRQQLLWRNSWIDIRHKMECIY